MKKVLKTQGFNLGQMHHFAHLEWNNNGYIPDEIITQIKSLVAPELLEVCRMSGTMSNHWAADLPGYNHNSHTIQINNRRQNTQPTESYLYAFIDFYKKMGFKELVWTVNTISPWMYPNERQLWENRMWAMLDELDKQGIKISVICMENEMWMYPQCVVMPNGNLPFAQKLIYSPLNALRNDTWWANNIIKPRMRDFLAYLDVIAYKIKKRYPNIKIALSTDNNTHMRGRLLTEVIQEFRFYDIICPHIYIKATNKTDLENQVRQRLNHAKVYGREIWVTEFNWDYGANDSGQAQGAYHDNFFKTDMLQALDKFGAHAGFFHTLWSGRSSYGFVPMVS